MTIRRLLDRIGNSKSWRRELKRPKKKEPQVFTLRDRIIDANNRFNVLLLDLFEEDVASHEFEFWDEDPATSTGTWILDDGTPRGRRDRAVKDPFPVPDITDTRYFNTAEANVMRLKMGYPPKSMKGFSHPPSRDRPEYKQVKNTIERYNNRTKLLALLKRLGIWRLQNSEAIRNGGDIDDITPLTLIEPIERWASEHRSLGGAYHTVGASMIPDLALEWRLDDPTATGDDHFSGESDYSDSEFYRK